MESTRATAAHRSSFSLAPCSLARDCTLCNDGTAEAHVCPAQSCQCRRRAQIEALPPIVGTLYPTPFDVPCCARERKKLGDAAGLTQFGVNLLTLPPGAWSSQRHWHTESDEFVYVIQGEVTLVTDGSEEILGPGDAAGFKAGESNGHCLRNNSQSPALVLEVGSRMETDAAYYPDLDLVAPPKGKPAVYTHRDTTPYTDIKRRGPESL